MSPEMLYLLVTLVTAHVLADFPLQSGQMVTRKRAGKWPGFLAHGLVHWVASTAIVGHPGLAPVWAVLAAVHWLLDRLKALAGPRPAGATQREASPRRDLAVFAGDQVAHLLVIVGFARLAAAWIRPGRLWTVQWLGLDYLRLCLIVTGLAISVHVGAVVVGLLTETFRRELADARRSANPAGREALSPSEGFANGGRVIGQLERTLVFALMLMSALGAVAFLAAAKSIFRFGELRNSRQRKEAEYILIGTLMSFTWALVVAWLTSWALGALDSAAAGPAWRNLLPRLPGP